MTRAAVGLPGGNGRVLNPSVAERPPPIPQIVTELWELVVAYFKQETTEPLKAIGRVVAFGVAGSLLLGFGVVFLTVGGLRVLQEETGTTFIGNWSWVPYLIMTVLLALGGALTWKVGARRKEKREAA
ncbi:MAG: phage holin family protein [Actinobacteria bacterium]|nr:phage holin family protein [Actinomycetota bacterium]